MITVTASLLIVLGIIGLGFFYFLLVLGNAISIRRLRKKYKEEQDASKQGEKRRQLEGGRIPAIPEGITEKERTRYPPLPTPNRKPTLEGYDKSKRGELLSTTDAYDVREDRYLDRQLGSSYESPRERWLHRRKGVK